jgi:AbrB family looped-hinge helix DNA binding protein
MMKLKVTSKRQVTFPRHVLEELGLRAGDHIFLVETEGGYLLRARYIDVSRLGVLDRLIRRDRSLVRIETCREASHDPSLRD